jgi:type VI secretion system protein ImpE
MAQDARSLYTEGHLEDAVEAATARVKARPTDGNARDFLAELLCAAGALERADKQLEVLTNQEADAAVGIALFRQLVRAEQTRQDFYREGRVPELLSEPTALLRKHLEASVMIRDGRLADAAALLMGAEEERPHLSGSCNGEAFDDFRDLDDLTAHFLEVLTTTGKYFWVPFDKVRRVDFKPPARPRDLLWRHAQLSVVDGPDGAVYVPAIYPATLTSVSDAARLGRLTDWQGGDGTPVRGIGQRTFVVGEEARAVMEINVLEFEQA